MSGPAELLAVRDARKVFRLGGLLAGKEVTAVGGVSFSLYKDRPDIFSIIGESGSGKTTLSRMILRLLLPDAGSIELDGKDVSQLDWAEDPDPPPASLPIHLSSVTWA